MLLESKRLGPALALLVVAGAVQAQGNCEPIRAGIEARIQAAGVTDFSVVTLDAAASAPGREVGRCERGSRKILYQRGEAGVAAATPAVTPSAKPATSAAPVITECKDGRVTVGGDCRR